jgi:hypothetical protein
MFNTTLCRYCGRQVPDPCGTPAEADGCRRMPEASLQGTEPVAATPLVITGQLRQDVAQRRLAQ